MAPTAVEPTPSRPVLRGLLAGVGSAVVVGPVGFALVLVGTEVGAGTDPAQRLLASARRRVAGGEPGVMSAGRAPRARNVGGSRHNLD